MEKTVFQKICDREIPARFVYEDEEVAAFHDIRPQAPVHILIVPKRPIPNLASATEQDQLLLGKLLLTAQKIAQRLGLTDGFRLVVNEGKNAGQEVPHIHIHMLAGRRLGWPPG